MKKVYENADVTMVGYFQSILDDCEIGTLVKHDPGIEFFHSPQHLPSLWVLEDADYEEAREVVNQYLQANVRTGAGEDPEWTCVCGETIDGSFGACWSCGASAPEPTQSG